MWSDAELALLAGTGIGERARTRRAQLEDTWQKIGACAAEADDAGEASDALRTFQLPDWRAFVHAETIASSRAFYVDAYHGEALVPCAEIGPRSRRDQHEIAARDHTASHVTDPERGAHFAG